MAREEEEDETKLAAQRELQTRIRFTMSMHIRLNQALSSNALAHRRSTAMTLTIATLAKLDSKPHYSVAEPSSSVINWS